MGRFKLLYCLNVKRNKEEKEKYETHKRFLSTFGEKLEMKCNFI